MVIGVRVPGCAVASRYYPLLHSWGPTLLWPFLYFFFFHVFSTSIAPMSTPNGNRFYRIFSAFGSFPAVRYKPHVLFHRTIFRKFERLRMSLLIVSKHLLAWVSPQICFGNRGHILAFPPPRTKALGSMQVRALANIHLSMHRM